MSFDQIAKRDRVEQLYINHPRHWKDFHYVYPVLSRRAGGISLGIDLSPACECTFNCVYCQIEPHNLKIVPPQLDLDVLHEELYTLFRGTIEGRLYENSPFDETPANLRRLNDAAFSGSGEPTLSPLFLKAVSVVADVRHHLASLNPSFNVCENVKTVLITNSTCFHKPEVQQALDILMENNGEIWAKLDAGTEEFYRRINRSAVSFERVLNNITQTAQRHPLVIQTLFSDYHQDGGPDDPQTEAYIRRLEDILSAGGKITLVQVHTVCRIPAETGCEPLARTRLENIAQRIHNATGLPVSVHN